LTHAPSKARTPYEGFAALPVIAKLNPVGGTLGGMGPSAWIPNGGLLAASFDEFENTSSIWRWSAVDGSPERVVTMVKGRVTELVPDASGERAIVGVTRAPDGIGAVTARTDLYLIGFEARSVVPIFKSSKTMWIRVRAFARFSTDERRIAFSCTRGAGRPPFEPLLIICETANGARVQAFERDGTVIEWTDRGLLVRSQPGRPGAASYHSYNDRTGGIEDARPPSSLSPDSLFEVRIGETSLSIRDRRGRSHNVPARKQAGWLRHARHWLAPHRILFPVDLGWLALDVETRTFRRLFARGEGGHPMPSPDGTQLLVHRGGELFWAAVP
jgi:hypothetical protein